MSVATKIDSWDVTELLAAMTFNAATFRQQNCTKRATMIYEVPKADGSTHEWY